MSFLSPAWLALATAGLLVIYLHRRREPRERLTSSTFLWEAALAGYADQPERGRIAPNALLWLHLLFLLLVSLALAQPIWGDPDGQDDHLIVILDASGSMQATDVAPSRFAAGREKVGDAARTFLRQGGRRALSLIIAEARPYVAAARFTRPDDVEAVLASLQGTDTAITWEDVRRLVEGLIIQGDRSRILVVTDGAGDDLAASFASAFEESKGPSPEVSVQFLFVGQATGNSSLTRLKANAPQESEGDWIIEGALRHFGDQPRDVQLRFLFEPEGAPGSIEWHRMQLHVLPEQEARFQAALDLPGPGVLELELTGDALTSDNRAYLVLREPRVCRALQLGGDNPRLQAALQALPGVDASHSGAPPPDIGVYDLIIVDGIPLDRPPSTNTLWVGLAPGSANARLPLPDPMPTGWYRAHPLNRGVDYTPLEVRRAQLLPLLKGAEVILEAGGRPLIQARTTPSGREVAVAFALQDSNWGDLLSFPAFMSNLAAWACPAQGPISPPGAPGDSYSLPPEVIGQSWNLEDPAGSPVALPGWVLSDRDSQANGIGWESEAEPRWVPRAFEAMFQPKQAGLYTLSSEGKRFPLAVNAINALESDIRPKPWINQAGAAATGFAAADRALARWLLAAACLVLVLEALWAGFLPEAALPFRPWLRRHGRGRPPRTAIGLRAVMLACLACALAGVPWYRAERDRALVMVVDGGARATADVEAPLASMLAKSRQSPHTRVGVVEVGAGATIARPLARGRAPRALPEPDDVSSTNLEAGLDLAIGMIPPALQARVVVISDGRQTRGEASRVLPRFAARGVPIDFVPVERRSEREVLVEEVTAPENLHAGDPFTLHAILFSSVKTSAIVHIWRDGQRLVRRPVELLAGRNRLTAEFREESPGAVLYEVEVETEQDGFLGNNRAGVPVRVRGPADVAIVAERAEEGKSLADALRVQGLTARVLLPHQVPWDMAGWQQYDVMVLVNVPAIDLHSQQQSHLESFVRDFGGGLVVLGGENTFGPGGYYQTVFERVLPLSSRVPRDAPGVAMLFVLDKSGSMQQQEGEATRLDIAKAATLTAVDLLGDESLVGIVVFDSQATVLMPVQPVKNKADLPALMRPLQPGGGTSLYPALAMAYEQLRPVKDMASHMVVMTDGLSQPGAFEEIAREITAAGITLSTVAIGSGADVGLLTRLARQGNGVAHVTADWQALPSILAQEALLRSETLVMEEAVTPKWTASTARFTEGLPRRLPPLRGYVRTSAKPAASVHLEGSEEVPLLASWRYGIGRVIAFSSQGIGPWASDWVEAPWYPRLWAQAIRWAMPAAAGPGLHLTMERVGDSLRLRVDALAGEGVERSGLALAAQVVLPGGKERTAPLPELAPGEHEGHIFVDNKGIYRATVDEEELAYVVSYPAKYGGVGDGSRLGELVQASGGRLLLGDEALFAGKTAARWVRDTGWPYWTLIALLWFLPELLVRFRPGWLAPFYLNFSRKGSKHH